MRIALLLTLVSCVFPLAAGQDGSTTYWNYSWHGVSVEPDNSVHVYRDSCAGYGTALPNTSAVVAGPILPWSSVPDPEHDCDPETRVVILVLL